MAEGPGEMREHFYCGGFRKRGVLRFSVNSLNLPTQEEVSLLGITFGLIILWLVYGIYYYHVKMRQLRTEKHYVFLLP